MPDEPTLRIGDSGDSGEWVTYLQQLLENQHFGNGFTAGRFDEATHEAVVLAQQQYGLEPTGICEGDTWAALLAAAVGASAPEATVDVEPQPAFQHHEQVPTQPLVELRDLSVAPPGPPLEWKFYTVPAC